MTQPKNPERIRYTRLAPVYDLMEFLPEILTIRKWRRRLISYIKGGLTLEIGVGTGKNLPFYPNNISLVGADISEKMIKLARNKQVARNRIHFAVINAEELALKEAVFENIVSTFVFCSVSDPVKGLKELRRVLKPGGQVLFLEHVRPRSPVLARLFDFINPVVVSIWGANINRATVVNIRKAGFEIRTEVNLWRDIVKLIVAT